jgi:flavodoxin
MNTEKIAKVMARVLVAEIKRPQQISPEELAYYNLVGFGSGIYSSKPHKSILELAEKLPMVKNKKAFIFSTCGAPAFAVDGGQVDDYLEKVHFSIRVTLRSKGYKIVDEFICSGWNTNSFLKLIGGINKGRPNEKDLKNAEEFAESLLPKSYVSC